MKTVVVIQSRMSSSRLPGKALMKVGSKLLIDHVIERAVAIENVNDIYLATSNLISDDTLTKYVSKKYSINVLRGDIADVRSRFTEIAKLTGADAFIRITGDDPFKDPLQASLALKILTDVKSHYVCNFEPRQLPLGMDIEVFTAEALSLANLRYTTDLDKEHVTWSMRNGNFLTSSVKNQIFDPNIRLTVDSQSDLQYCSRISTILESVPGNFSWERTKNAIITESTEDNYA